LACHDIDIPLYPYHHHQKNGALQGSTLDLSSPVYTLLIVIDQIQLINVPAESPEIKLQTYSPIPRFLIIEQVQKNNLEFTTGDFNIKHDLSDWGVTEYSILSNRSVIIHAFYLLFIDYYK
jgi:hypothetical protein